MLAKENWTKVEKLNDIVVAVNMRHGDSWKKQLARYKFSGTALYLFFSYY